MFCGARGEGNYTITPRKQQRLNLSHEILSHQTLYH